MTQQSNIQRLHQAHVAGTAPKALVTSEFIQLTGLTNKIRSLIGAESQRVYITVRTLKHVYDKRPAVEYDLFMRKAWKIVRFPQWVYLNKDTKRSNYLFVKQIDDNMYLCCIELVLEPSGQSKIFVSTMFKTDQKYLRNYKLLWSWEDGTSPS